ncbi:arylamine N-acetyltransferase family protein [Streptomyces sp. H27-H5]|uniref:arylamine N-acetyltransferase family protein n=1 Tax=Streptomyces sp. H27-H5 TaxID=2996460 RepID=UPI00226DD497|nr:arylamine N-acetyltransferase [Streptomyces sp. H27-H5]MCY0959407.1 arylamine N-acetyltransferase [Streptomyces sp. H27-H5]
MISDLCVDYLRRLGVEPAAPSVEGLFALQRAHLERVPYENIDIQLGRPPGIDPELSARRLAAGRGGYCFHLNGAFSALLEALGYDVTRHVGGVCKEPDARGVNGDHLALVVRVDGAAFFVDVGLGDGPHEPLPLREDTFERGDFRYALERLAPLDGEAPGWTYRNPGGPFPVMNFRSAPATMADFASEHLRLSTSQDSGFVRTFAMLRRDAHGIDALRGRVLSRIDPLKGTTDRELHTPEEFFGVLAGVFGRSLDDLTARDRAALWERVDRAHETWRETRDEPPARAAQETPVG